MKLLNRYVVKQFLPPFLVGLAIFTFLLVINQLFLIMDLFLNRGVDLGILLRMVWLIFPMFLPLSIPMAALLAALLCYGRLSEEGEITAFRSGGLALIQYCWPNLLLGFLLSLLLIYFNLNLAPEANMEFKNIHYAVAQQNPLALFAPKVMNHFGEYKVYVEKMDRRKRVISGVSIYRMNPDSGPTRILAPEGEVVSSPGDGLMIKLTNGAVHQPSQDKNTQYTITKFNRFSLRIPVRSEESPRPVTAREMTYSELREKAAEALQNRLSPQPWRTEAHARIAVAFAPFMFIMLGTVLGVQVRRGSKSVGIGMSLIVIVAYYGLLVFMVSVASGGNFSPFILTWVPNLSALLLGGGLWIKVAAQ